MRFVTNVVASLLLSCAVASACSVVEVINSQPSSQSVQIRTLQKGTPLKNVRIEIFTMDPKVLLFSVTTNHRGVASLPTLSPGRYLVAATGATGLGADLVLDVSKDKGRKTSLFSMELSLRPPPPPTMDERMTDAEKMPIREPVKEFVGILQDPAGGSVPNATVTVYAKGSRDKARALEIKTDGTGRFSAPLADGTYTILFEAPGFQTEIAVFEISGYAQARDLRISLKLGLCT